MSKDYEMDGKGRNGNDYTTIGDKVWTRVETWPLFKIHEIRSSESFHLLVCYFYMARKP
jgi:hypothetical protein